MICCRVSEVDGSFIALSPLQTNVYCSLPLRLVSRGWGWMADRHIPTPFRSTVYGVYSTAFGVNLNEAMDPDFKYVSSIPCDFL